MASRWLPSLVTVTGVAAAWAATRCAGFTPVLWVALLVSLLFLPVVERCLVNRRWLAAGLLLLALSWTVAADHELAFRHSLLVLAAMLLFSLARRAVPDERLIGVLALGIGLAALVAIGQALGGLERASTLVGALRPGLHEAAATRLASGRVFGTSALPGHFAALMLLAAPLIVERGWRAGRRGRAGWAAVLLVTIAAMVLTRSLAAPLVAALLLLLMVARGLGGRRAWFAVGVVAVAAMLAVAMRPDLATLEPLRLRWVNWRTALWVFVHHPWLGVGLGGVGQAGLVAPTAAANITPYAHNTYLQLLAEFGVAGLGLLGAGVWGLQRLIGRGLASQPGLALAVATVPLHNLLDFSAYSPEVLLPWAVLAGTLAGRTLAPPPQPVRGAVLLAVAGGGALLATLAWRGEVEMDAVVAAPPAQAWERALSAARWAPWAVTPLESAAGAALQAGAPSSVLSALDRRLTARGWVMPRSASWAEARSRLLLALGSRGEARAWAGEARRRAPTRKDLVELEAACAVP